MRCQSQILAQKLMQMLLVEYINLFGVLLDREVLVHLNAGVLPNDKLVRFPFLSLNLESRKKRNLLKLKSAKEACCSMNQFVYTRFKCLG